MNYNATLIEHNTSISTANDVNTSNTAALSEMLDAVNALSDAGSSGTCRLRFIYAGAEFVEYVHYCTPEGWHSDYWWMNGNEIEVNCNSFVLLQGAQSTNNTVEGSDGLEVRWFDGTDLLVYVPNAPGAELEIGIS